MAGPLDAVDLRALSPLKWQHVNPYGTFTLNMQERLPLEQVAVVPWRDFAEISAFARLRPTGWSTYITAFLSPRRAQAWTIGTAPTATGTRLFW